MFRKIIVFMILLTNTLFMVAAQRSLYSETIPMQGHIELQESFTLEVNRPITFTLTDEMAGTTHEVASYQFFSNSPDVVYQLRLSPGYTTTLGEGVFAFRSVSRDSAIISRPPIPFKLSVLNRVTQDQITDDEFRAIQKSIGEREGSRVEEQGSIYVTFPTVEEGFNLQGFTFGAYEASIAVEVLAD
jgi:hypothetical protein